MSALRKSFSEYFLPSTPGSLKSGAREPSGSVSGKVVSAAETLAAAANKTINGQNHVIGQPVELEIARPTLREHLGKNNEILLQVLLTIRRSAVTAGQYLP